MKVLGIHGSPRQGGNSQLLLEQALQGARSAGAQVSILRAAELDLRGCRECGGCEKTGECVVDDEMQQVYPLLDAADRMVLSTPVFFYGPPAQLKALIDRVQARWSRRMLTQSAEERKKHSSGAGYLIAVGATQGKRLFEGLELTARFFFDALDKDYRGGLFFRGIDQRGAIRDHPDALRQAYELGQRIGRGRP